MSPRVTFATARRVLEQLRGDRRTLALLLLVPCVLMILLRLVYAGQPAVFDRLGLQLLGIFPFVTMFLVTSVAMLRERTGGTLERLLTTPMAKLDLLLGYALAFGVAALSQAALASAVTLGGLGLDVAGTVPLVLVVAVANALLGMALGLFVSAFARTEFQAVQFMPAVVLPQILLCGLLVPRDEMAAALEAISAVLPMTYAVDAMTLLTHTSSPSRELLVDLAVITLAGVAALALGALTLRRRTA
jgi:ABC-2 type transport system permease protein